MDSHRSFMNHYRDDSIFMVAIRVVKSLEIRLRGRVYKAFKVFSKAPGRVVIGRGLTLKGGRCVQLKGNIKIG